MNASLRQLNVNASALARRAEAGETITITDRGKPIVDLVPHRPRFRFARKDDVMRALRGAGDDSHTRFRQQMDDIVDPYFDEPAIR
ncbi:MAG: type II toxin-antitoxin system prevent-host-death family antitoxin [Acidimicrobiia bacterium]|nr:type II toxin-antitoxin system prevent-host-death family antitoxin [Acidimicrobiia bacterium]